MESFRSRRGASFNVSALFLKLFPRDGMVADAHIAEREKMWDRQTQ
jgi:hypothetical protein